MTPIYLNKNAFVSKFSFSVLIRKNRGFLGLKQSDELIFARMEDNFVAIDFETATGYRNSACAVGIVTVRNGEIVDKYYTLIQPPGNQYWWKNIQVHRIRPADTVCVPSFEELYPQIRPLLEGNMIVAHNEAFDRNVLKHTMAHYGLDYNELCLAERWECTVKIYRRKGYRPANLKACCQRNNIPLNHHEALSDAVACAKLYLLR